MSRTTKVFVIAFGTFLFPAGAAFAVGIYTPGAITNVSQVYLGVLGTGGIASDLGNVTGTTTVTDGVNTLGFVANAGGYFAGSNYAASTPILGDTGLNSLMNTTRYAPTLSTSIPVTFGDSYVLQLLFYEPAGAPNPGRVMTVTIEGDVTTIAPTTVSPVSFAAKLDYAFTAGDSSLNISLAYVADNATISGFSLRNVTPAPEPTSLTLFSLAAVGLMRIVRRRR